jgi:hypothetical protein
MRSDPMYSYEDIFESDDEEITVTREQMWRECARHGSDPRELVAELGDHDSYSAKAVLFWLGW